MMKMTIALMETYFSIQNAQNQIELVMPTNFPPILESEHLDYSNDYTQILQMPFRSSKLQGWATS